jgi:hypothetical protein
VLAELFGRESVLFEHAVRVGGVHGRRVRAALVRASVLGRQRVWKRDRLRFRRLYGWQVRAAQLLAFLPQHEWLRRRR